MIPALVIVGFFILLALAWPENSEKEAARRRLAQEAATREKARTDAGEEERRQKERLAVETQQERDAGIAARVPSLQSAPLDVPTNCPSCAALLIQDGEYLVCKNEDCETQAAGSLKRWVKKLDVKFVGESLLEAMSEAYPEILTDEAKKNVRYKADGTLDDKMDPADLYTLDPQAVADLDVGGGRAGASASKAIKNLTDKMTLPIYVIVGSLGIPNIGRGSAKTISDAGFNTLSKMLKAKYADIAAIPGIGDSKAKDFVEGFQAKAGLIAKLLANGIQVQQVSGHLLGQTFCPTGFRSAQLAAAIEKAGGSWTESFSRKCNYLICNDHSSTGSKAAKAASYGTKIISIDEAWRIVIGGSLADAVQCIDEDGNSGDVVAAGATLQGRVPKADARAGNGAIGLNEATGHALMDLVQRFDDQLAEEERLRVERLAESERLMAALEAAAERQKAEEDACIAEYLRLRERVIAPVLTAFAVRLTAAGHLADVSTPGSHRVWRGRTGGILVARPPPEGAVNTGKDAICLNIVPKAIPRRRFTPGGSSFVEFSFNATTKKITIFCTDTDTDPFNEIELSDVTREKVEEEVLKGISFVLAV